MSEKTLKGDPPDRGKSENLDVEMEGDDLYVTAFEGILGRRKSVNSIHNNINTSEAGKTGSRQVTKTSINSDKVRPTLFYEASDKGPFIVYIENKTGNIGRAHLITVGKIINKALPKMEHYIRNISSIGMNRVKVEMASALSANKLINNDYLKNNSYEAYIPQFFKRRQGVVKYVDVELSESELKEAIKPVLGDNFNVVEVRRLNRKIVDKEGQVKYVPSSTIKVTFSGQNLPKKIVIHSIIVEVEPYIQKVVQCMKCMRYGHLTGQCKGGERCAKCGESHITTECNSTKEFCVICKREDHRANNYKLCPEFKKQKSIKNIMGMENLSYREAVKKYDCSYASVTNKNNDNNLKIDNQTATGASKKRRVGEGGNPLWQDHLSILKAPVVEHTPIENFRNTPQYHRQVNNNNDHTVNSITNFLVQLVKDIIENKNELSLNDNLLVTIKDQINHILSNHK